MKISPGLRAFGALFKDIRAALVAIVVVAAAAGGVAVLDHHVRVRAGVAILVVAVVFVALVMLDWLRFRERERVVRVQGALDEARHAASQAAAERQPNPAAEEVLRLIGALRGTLERRAQPYGGHTSTLDASTDEIMRSRDLVGRVRVLIGGIDESAADLLRRFENPTDAGCPSVAMLLSGVDHMEALVTSWGLRCEHPGPAPPTSARQIATTPTHTVVISHGGPATDQETPPPPS